MIDCNVIVIWFYISLTALLISCIHSINSNEQPHLCSCLIKKLLVHSRDTCFKTTDKRRHNLMNFASPEMLEIQHLNLILNCITSLLMRQATV